MDSIVSTIALSHDLELQLKKVARQRGQTKTSLIQEAVREFLARQELTVIERKMQAKARSLGIESDEDVVSMIHEVRRKPSP